MPSSSGEDLADFWTWVAKKGLVKETTAASRRRAIIEVLDALGDDPASIDVRELDIDDALRRFENLKAAKYTPNSLTTYKSRFRKGVEEFLDYQDNPSGWQPAIKPRAARTKKHKKDAQAGPAHSVTASHSHTESPWPSSSSARLIEYPFPVRQGVFAILKLPSDLKASEAERLSAWLDALAIPDDPQNGGSG